MPDAEIAERIEEARKELGEKVIILGHHYQREDVIAHADLTGDSYQLSVMASQTESRPHLLPAKIIAMPTGGKQTPKIARIDSPHKLLIGTPTRKGLIDIAAMYFKHDLWVGNPRSMLCSRKFCPIFNECHWRLTGDSSDDNHEPAY